MEKRWEIKQQIDSKLKDLKLRRQKILALLLKNRGVKVKNKVAEFLNPSDPYLINSLSLGFKKVQLTKAINRVKKAILNKQTIVVYGDYDADGICATGILWETLNRLQAKVMPFIPDREKHGYGLNREGIDEVVAKFNPQLIITVDNGIVANDGVLYANKKGIDVIITDHHQPAKKVPPALSIIWSDKIAGAGVAWFLAKELYQALKPSLLGFKASNSLELACIGTVTDMMPVLEVNRSIIKYGIKELQQSQRPGIKALCQESGIVQAKIGTYEIGYIIGPRLNAMGRLEDALESLRLLCTNDDNRALSLARKLGLTNRQRQQLTETTFDHAKSLWSKNKKDKIIYVANSSYNQGIVGLVAGRLVDEYYKPAVVVSQEDEYSKGSVRSVDGFNIIEFLRNFNDLFEDLGGHPMAAGFNIKTSNLAKLQQQLTKLADKKINDKLLQPKVKIDVEIDFQDINWQLVKKLEEMSPFGLGNPRPVFSVRDIKVVKLYPVGRDRQHLKLELQKGQSPIYQAIAFGQGKLIKKLGQEQLVDVCFSLDINVWNGDESLQLMVKDIKLKT